MWRSDEWFRDGAWTRTEPSEEFDVAPFAQGFFTSGRTVDTARWIRPPAIEVTAFDIYWFHMPAMGDWQYRVDDGAWTNVGVSIQGADNRLHRHLVVEAVHERVEIRGFDGRAPCVAPIAGINLYANTARDGRGTIVHNLGCNFDALLWFCRASAGDPLALLDDLRPDVVTVLFSNDVQYGVEQQYADSAPCADYDECRSTPTFWS